MKKIVFVAIVVLLGVTLNADAFHWRLFHHHRPAAVQGGSVLPLGIAQPLVSGPFLGASSATIEVPRQVGDNLKSAQKNLSESSASLSPLLEKYNLTAPTASTSGNSAAVPPKGPALRTMTADQLDAVTKILLGKQP